MNTVLSPYMVSISELKKNPSSLLDESNGEPIAILNHNKPTAYLIPAKTYEKIIELMEDADWMKIIEERSEEKEHALEVNLDEL